MAKFGRFDNRNKKAGRNKKNSIDKDTRIKESENDWYDKNKFRQAVANMEYSEETETSK